nr:CotH kinase family protein [Acholeplasma laidlawii]
MNSFRKRLGSKHLGGDLYKVGWDYEKGGSLTMDTINKIGVENEDESYFPVYDLKTNKKNNEHILLKTLIQTLNQDTDFSSLVNMNYYLVYEAISYLVGNPDDLRHHYNNYYIYFLKDTDQAIFIPYDFDRTFGVTRDWNPSGDGMTSYSPYAKMTTMGGVDDQINPLVLKTVVKGAPEVYLENYKKVILEAMSTKFYKDEMFNEVYQIRKEIYDNAVNITISGMDYFECLFNYNETKNMKFSSYLSGKTTTINQTIDD